MTLYHFSGIYKEKRLVNIQDFKNRLTSLTDVSWMLASKVFVDGLYPVIYMQFFINMINMLSNRFGTDVQAVGYFLVQHAFGKQFEYFFFAV